MNIGFSFHNISLAICALAPVVEGKKKPQSRREVGKRKEGREGKTLSIKSATPPLRLTALRKSKTFNGHAEKWRRAECRRAGVRACVPGSRPHAERN